MGVVVCKASVLDKLGGLDLAMGVVVCKASMLGWLGVHLPSIYMHCTRSCNGCSSLQGICTQLTGGLNLAVGVVVCKASVLDTLGGLDLAMGVVVCKASMLGWLGVHLPSIYMHCTRSCNGCSSMQGICTQLTGGLNLAVGVAVCKASMLD